MKNSLLVFCWLFCPLFILGQSLVIPYERCTDCGSNPDASDSRGIDYDYVMDKCSESDIEGDFSRRICCSNKWHKGIDISPEANCNDLGDAIIALESDTIVRFQTSGYKYLVIDGQEDFGYGHLFDARNYSLLNPIVRGDFIFWKDSLGMECIIDKKNCKAYSDMPNVRVVLPDMICADTVFTTNMVSAGDRIAPLGTSGNNGYNYEAHLHLYDFKNPTGGTKVDNCFDPLQALTETSQDYKFYLAFNESTTIQLAALWSVAEFCRLT